MTWYKTGTVAVTQGSNAVIGTGTSFIANSRVGDGFRGPDGGWYEITNIASDTAMSIAPAYGNPSAYSIAPLQGYLKDSADALRAATMTFAGGVADMEEQVAVATEAAESAAQSKAGATEQASIATSAAATSTNNKDAAQLAAQQSSSSAQTSGAAADRAETAKTSIIQSEQAAAASAAAAADSAEQAEAVTIGKADKGDNNDITSLRALSADGFDRIRQGVATFAAASASVAGVKGLVPAPSAGATRFLSSLGTWLTQSFASISGDPIDNPALTSALNARLPASDAGFAFAYPNGGTEAAPANVALNSRYPVTNPFPGKKVICYAEIQVAGVWGITGWAFLTGSGGIGVSAGQLSSGDLVVQTGQFALCAAGNAGGTPLVVASNITTATPCRVVVIKVKG